MTNEQAKQLRQKLASVKKANDPREQLVAALRSSAQAQLGSAQKSEWARLLAGSVGVGGILAGLNAYKGMSFDRQKKKYPQHVQDLPIPYTQKAGALEALTQAAGELPGRLMNAGVETAGNVARQFYTPDAEVKDHRMLSSYPIGASAAIMGGLYLGNAGTKALLSKLRASRQEAELAKTREEFRQELLGLQQKTSAALTRSYARIKAATGPADVGNLVRNGSLALATMALPLGFVNQYQRTSKFDDRRAVREALKARARLREAQQPADLYAVLEPSTPGRQSAIAAGE